MGGRATSLCGPSSGLSKEDTACLVSPKQGRVSVCAMSAYEFARHGRKKPGRELKGRSNKNPMLDERVKVSNPLFDEGDDSGDEHLEPEPSLGGAAKLENAVQDGPPSTPAVCCHASRRGATRGAAVTRTGRSGSLGLHCRHRPAERIADSRTSAGRTGDTGGGGHRACDHQDRVKTRGKAVSRNPRGDTVCAHTR